MDGTTESIKWASAISTRASLEAAIDEVVAELKPHFAAAPDLALVFISSAFASEFSRLLPLLHEAMELPVVIGCSGGGVVGMMADNPMEVEGEPALSLSLASLPGVGVHPFHLSSEELPDLDSPPDSWTKLIGVDSNQNPQFILMADPASMGINDLLQGLDFAYAQAPKVGGLAGANSFSRSSGLFCDRTLHSEGIVGVALTGDIILDTIVAQGCRPIGATFQILEAERNILLTLEGPGAESGRPPLEILQELFQNLSEEDRQLAQNSLFIGIAQDSFKQSLEPGDFLIRNLLGVDPKIGAIAVGDRLRPGQRVQFHLRDAKTSAEDLAALLQRYQNRQSASPAAALMFACMGRGEGLYREPNFDSEMFQQYLGQIPISGFFCNGEIGPIGGTTFLHGYTSVFGICRRP